MNKILSIFDKYSNLLLTFSTKQDGNLRLKSVGDPDIDRNTQQNRINFFKRNNIDKISTVTPVLEHGIIVKEVNRGDVGKLVRNADALITNEPGIFLNLTVADCLPIFLYDSNKKVIALVHAGWRGLAAKILKQVIKKFRKKYHSFPDDIIVGVGPGICKKHYEVKSDVASKFLDFPDAIIELNNNTYLDIKLIAQKQLLKLGILQENIEINQECTYEAKDKYFSYRRDLPAYIEAQLAIFGMKDN